MALGFENRLLQYSDLYSIARRTYSHLPYKFSSSGKAFRPWHFGIEITLRCNLRCQMCHYIDWLENVPIREQMEGELSTDEWLGVIDQLPRWSFITFTGGESFVRKDFLDILTYASRKARTHFISNTTMMPEDRAQKVVALAPRRFGGLGLNFIGVSIEGPRDVHDHIRRLNGAWDRTIAGVARLREAKRIAGKTCPLIHITTVLQEDNVDSIHLLPGICADNGIDVVNFVTETRMHDLPELGCRHPGTYQLDDLRWPKIDRERLTKALDQTEREAKRLGVELRLPRMPRRQLLDYYDPAGKLANLNLDEYECRNAWNSLYIGRKGDVNSCWIHKLGNVRDSNILELWTSEKMVDFRQSCQKGIFAPCPGCCLLEHKTDRSCR